MLHRKWCKWIPTRVWSWTEDRSCCTGKGWIMMKQTWKKCETDLKEVCLKDGKIHQDSNMHEKECNSRKLRIDCDCVCKKYSMNSQTKKWFLREQSMTSTCNQMYGFKARFEKWMTIYESERKCTKRNEYIPLFLQWSYWFASKQPANVYWMKEIHQDFHICDRAGKEIYSTYCQNAVILDTKSKKLSSSFTNLCICIFVTPQSHVLVPHLP